MIALYILIGLQVLDVITTLVALRNPKLQEGNKYLKWLMDRIGVAPTLLAIKGGFIAWLYYVNHLVPQEILWLLCAGYAWVVRNNMNLIRRV